MEAEARAKDRGRLQPWGQVGGVVLPAPREGTRPALVWGLASNGPLELPLGAVAGHVGGVCGVP